MKKTAIIALLLVLMALAGTAFSLDSIGIADLNIKVNGVTTGTVILPLDGTGNPTEVFFDLSVQNFAFSGVVPVSGTIELIDPETYELIPGTLVEISSTTIPGIDHGGGLVVIENLGPIELAHDFKQGPAIVRVFLNEVIAGEYMGNNSFETSIVVIKEQAPLPIDELRLEIVVLLGLFVVGFIGSQKR